jgi:hypothetical protein
MTCRLERHVIGRIRCLQRERPQSNPKSINDIKAYKRAIRPLLEEYFVSGDIEELRQYVIGLGAVLRKAQCLLLIRDVEAMDAPYFGFELVKRAVILSIDRTDRERDLTSHMIAEFYSVLLSSLQISRPAFVSMMGAQVLTVPLCQGLPLKRCLSGAKI